MTTRSRVAVTVTLLILKGAGAAAQVCAGLPSLHERPIIVSLDGGRSNTGSSIDVGITAGRSLFGGLFTGSINYQDISFAAQTLDAASTTTGAMLGYEFALAADQRTPGARLGICPIVTAEYENGPDADVGGTRLDSDGWTLGAGASVGGLLLDRKPWRLFPYAAASYVYASATVHDVPFAGTDTEAHDSGGLLAFGVGVGIGGHVTVSAGMNFPVAIEGGENSFTFGVNFGFGRDARSASGGKLSN